MIINHNLGSMNAQRNMGINSTNASKSMEKLSSGLRINRAGDDAAGLAISEKMRGQIRGLDQASANAQDAISLIQTGEGALNETQSILQRMRELAVQSSSDTNVGTDRKQIQGEMDQLATEITRISNTTEFNQKNLLGGNLNDTYQVGANKGQNINLSVKAMDAQTLGVAAAKTTTTGTTNGANASNVEFDSTVGSAIVDGVNITLDAADNTGADSTVTVKAATAGDSITIDTGVVGTAGNTLKINLTTSAADALSVTNGGGGTINIALAKTTVASNTAAAIEAALQALGTVNGVDLSGATVTAGGSWDTAAIATGETGAVNFAGGAAANAAETIITLDNGTTTQKVTVADNATSVSVTSGPFNGISFDVADATSLASGSDSIDVAQVTTASAKATFAADGTMTDASVAAGIDVSSQTAANTAIKTINDAIESVSTERSKLGAYQNRLEHTIANLGTSSENLTSAESRIRDVDMAKEMSTFSKNNILSQAAQAMLAQANQQPQQVLQLLR